MLWIIGRETMESRANVLTINVLLMIAGIWLMITAFAFQYPFGNLRFGSPPQTNEFWIGVLIFVIALICAIKPSASSWLSWVNVALGIWLVVAPFVLGYAYLTVALWNEVIVGLIVVGLGTWSAREGRRELAAPR